MAAHRSHGAGHTALVLEMARDNPGWATGASRVASGWAGRGRPGMDAAIVSVPLGGHEAAPLLGALSAHGVICSARDGNLRLAVHFYNHQDDIDRLVTALTSKPGEDR